MTTPLFFLALLTLAGFILLAADLWLGVTRMRALHDYRPVAADRAPTLSVVVAARNEQRWIEAALSSLLAQDYPQLEVVAVNDRSADATGAILDQMAAGDPRLKVVHVERLPSGWLGKNHALQLGAAAAGGELLLFTDADVVMAPSTLGRAVTALRRERLDQLSALPDVPLPDPWLEAFAGVFGMNFLWFLRPWKARDPHSKRYIGIGAFTLLRAAAYRAVGGHRPIAMRPDDDIKLGKLIKKSGYRQELLLGQKLLTVEWYASFQEMVDGLMKNAYAGLDYRLWLALLVTAGQLGLFVWPYLALCLTSGPTWWLNLAAALLVSTALAAGARSRHGAWRAALAAPVMALLTVFILWRAIGLTYYHGGIRWRDTHYPLAALKANRV